MFKILIISFFYDIMHKVFIIENYFLRLCFIFIKFVYSYCFNSSFYVFSVYKNETMILRSAWILLLGRLSFGSRTPNTIRFFRLLSLSDTSWMISSNTIGSEGFICSFWRFNFNNFTLQIINRFLKLSWYVSMRNLINFIFNISNFLEKTSLINDI